MVLTTEEIVPVGVIKVSFEVSCGDWYLIQQSTPWRRIENLVEESETKGIRRSLTEKIEILEEP